MKNRKTWIIILVLILLAIGMYFLVTQREKPFNNLGFNTTCMISNSTEMSYIDTVLYMGLRELGLERITILIKPMDDNTKAIFDNLDMAVKAHVIGDGKQYILYVDKMNRRESVKFISHELIHIWQYHDDVLNISTDFILWKDNIILPDDFEYYDRPWEVEARKYGDILKKKLIQILYN